MTAPGRLVLFAAGLVAAFGLSYLVAGAVVPESVVSDWQRRGHAAVDATPAPCGCDHEGHR